MKIKILFSLLLALSITQLFAQEEEKRINKADKNFDNFAYIDAREVYLDVAKSGYKSENLFKKLGDSYYFNNDLSSALHWYEELFNYQRNIESPYLFRYAMSLKSVKKYKEADAILQQYYEKTGKSKVKQDSNAENYYLKLIKKQSGRFEIKKTSINSSFTDFSPAYYQSELVFASNRKTEKTKNKIDSWTNIPFLDLYKVNLRKDNTFGEKITPFSKTINSTYHESSPVFTKDGNTMYFTRNNYSKEEYIKSKKGTVLLKLFVSKKNEEGKWSEPKELPFNSNEYSCAHPTLNADEDKLYFTSDMPGTLGKSDIYVVNIYKDGDFSTPRNMGDLINTEAREAFPFITEEGLLYFSSDGHQGLGGYDIFVYELEEDGKINNNKPVNIGEPINSQFDDFSLILDTTDYTGFFASNRENQGINDDLYSFKQIEKPLIACKQTLDGYVTDETSKNGLSNVEVVIYNQEMELIKTTKTNEKGYYSFEVACKSDYLVRVKVKGYVSTENTLSTNQTDKEGNKVDISVKKGADLGILKIEQGTDLGKTLQLDPIYFDFDKSNIRYDAEVELQKILILMNKYQAIVVDIRSHTDSRGKREYNRKLSERRAQSTLEYLVDNGIEKNRLTAQGFGDSEIINQCVQGVECTEEEHQMNRRSEFILMNKDLTLIDASAIKVDYDNSKVSVPVEIIVEKNTNISQYYDFSPSSPQIYSVQIGALIKPKKGAYHKMPNVFYHTYSDHITRYFSGVFKSKRLAKKHLKKIRKLGVNGLLVKLEGENRK